MGLFGNYFDRKREKEQTQAESTIKKLQGMAGDQAGFVMDNEPDYGQLLKTYTDTIKQEPSTQYAPGHFKSLLQSNTTRSTGPDMTPAPTSLLEPASAQTLPVSTTPAAPSLGDALRARAGAPRIRYLNDEKQTNVPVSVVSHGEIPDATAGPSFTYKAPVVAKTSPVQAVPKIEAPNAGPFANGMGEQYANQFRTMAGADPNAWQRELVKKQEADRQRAVDAATNVVKGALQMQSDRQKYLKSPLGILGGVTGGEILPEDVAALDPNDPNLKVTFEIMAGKRAVPPSAKFDREQWKAIGEAGVNDPKTGLQMMLDKMAEREGNTGFRLSRVAKQNVAEPLSFGTLRPTVAPQTKAEEWTALGAQVVGQVPVALAGGELAGAAGIENTLARGAFTGAFIQGGKELAGAVVRPEEADAAESLKRIIGGAAEYAAYSGVYGAIEPKVDTAVQALGKRMGPTATNVLESLPADVVIGTGTGAVAGASVGAGKAVLDAFQSNGFDLRAMAKEILAESGQESKEELVEGIAMGIAYRLMGGKGQAPHVANTFTTDAKETAVAPTFETTTAPETSNPNLVDTPKVNRAPIRGDTGMADVLMRAAGGDMQKALDLAQSNPRFAAAALVLEQRLADAQANPVPVSRQEATTTAQTAPEPHAPAPVDRRQVLRDANPGMDEGAIVDLVRTTQDMPDEEFKSFAKRVGKPPEEPESGATAATTQSPKPDGSPDAAVPTVEPNATQDTVPPATTETPAVGPVVNPQAKEDVPATESGFELADRLGLDTGNAISWAYIAGPRKGERLSGTIQSINDDHLTVQTADGQTTTLRMEKPELRATIQKETGARVDQDAAQKPSAQPEAVRDPTAPVSVAATDTTPSVRVQQIKARMADLGPKLYDNVAAAYEAGMAGYQFDPFEITTAQATLNAAVQSGKLDRKTIAKLFYKNGIAKDMNLDEFMRVFDQSTADELAALSQEQTALLNSPQGSSQTTGQVKTSQYFKSREQIAKAAPDLLKAVDAHTKANGGDSQGFQVVQALTDGKWIPVIKTTQANANPADGWVKLSTAEGESGDYYVLGTEQPATAEVAWPSETAPAAETPTPQAEVTPTVEPTTEPTTAESTHGARLSDEDVKAELERLKAIQNKTADDWKNIGLYSHRLKGITADATYNAGEFSIVFSGPISGSLSRPLGAAGFRYNGRTKAWTALASDPVRYDLFEEIRREMGTGEATAPSLTAQDAAQVQMVQTPLEEAAKPETPSVDFEDAKRKRLAQSLRTVAQNTQAKVDQIRGVDRNTNTARRASMAAGALKEADSLEELAKATLAIADAIENGTLPDSLRNVKSRADVEELLTGLNLAHWDAIHAKASKEGEPFNLADLEHLTDARVPKATLQYSQIQDLLKWTKGAQGSVKARRSLESMTDYIMSNDTTGNARYDIPVNVSEVEALLEIADKRAEKDKSITTRWIRERLARPKRVKALFGNQYYDIVTYRNMLRDFAELTTGKTGKSEAQRRQDSIASMERELVGTKIPGYFPTPRATVEKLLEAAEIEPGMSVLEPSAGKGNIADVIRELSPEASLDTVEYQNTLRNILEAKGHKVVGNDFLHLTGQYDRIVMNPPFEQYQDVEHVQHAYDLLNSGGRLVAIMSEGPFFRSDKKGVAFREWMDEVGGTSEKLPEGSFKSSERPTGVATRMVVIDKPAEATPAEVTATGEPAREELEAVGLIRKWGDKWQYRRRPEGPWYYASTEASAMESATAAYKSTPANELLTADQRYEKANQEQFAAMDSNYGRYSLSQLKDMLDKASGVRGVGHEREFDVSRGRRTSAAVANQGARDAGEFRLKMNIYLQERIKRDLNDGKPVPPEVLSDYPDLQEKYGKKETATDPVKEVQAETPVTPSSESVEEKPTSPITIGSTATAKTERGTTIEAQYAIVDAGQLISSHDTALKPNEQYPQELQPRDRSRMASERQVNSIVQNLEPSFLGVSPKVSEGAPIVGPDMVVESGNGRVIALKRAYEQNHQNAGTYKQWLVDNAAKFGLDPKSIEAAQSPVLVRVRQTEVDRADFASQANEQSVAAMSATEQAVADAKKLDAGLMFWFNPSDSGEIVHPGNRDFIRSFLQKVVGPTEQGRYLTAEGQLSQEGISRIRNAVFAKAYGDTGAIEKLAESPDNNVRAITNGMLQAAGRVAQVNEGISEGRFFDVSLSKEITAAMSKLSALREQGTTVDDYLHPKQLSFLQDDIPDLSRDILEMFDRHKRSPKKIAGILGAYADVVEAAGDPRQQTLFAKLKPTQAEVWAAAVQRAEEDGNAVQTSLFEGPSGSGAGFGAGNQEAGPTAQGGQGKSALNKKPGQLEEFGAGFNPLRVFGIYPKTKAPTDPLTREIDDSITWNDQRLKKPSPGGNIVNRAVDAFVDEMVDSNASVRRAQERLAGNKQLSTDEDAYLRLNVLPKMVPGRTEAKAKEMAGILEPLGDRVRDYLRYADAKATIWRAKQFGYSFDEGKLPMRLESAQAYVDRVEQGPEAKQFTEAFDKEQKLFDGMLDELVDAGVLGADAVKSMREAYTEKDANGNAVGMRYIPMFRDMTAEADVAGEDVDTKQEGSGVAGQGRGAVNVPKATMRQHGSRRKLMDPVERRLRYVARVIGVAERNRAGQALARFAESFDTRGTELMAKVAPPMEHVSVKVGNIMEELEDLGADPKDFTDPNATIEFFKPKWAKDKNSTIITIYQDGKPSYYNVRDAAVLRSLTDTTPTVTGWMGKILDVAAGGVGLYKQGATITPSFTVANIVRDTAESYILSKHQLFPGHAMFEAIRLAATKDPLIQRMVYAGLKQGGFYRPETQSRDLVRQIENPGKVFTVRDLWNLYQTVREDAEFATRLGEASLEYKAQKKAGASENDAFLRALYEGGRITLNFTRGGYTAKTLNRYLPFFKIPFEAGYRLSEAVRENNRPAYDPRSFWFKAILPATTLAVATILLNRDDERYWEASDQERDKYLLVPVGKAMVRVPKPNGVFGVYFNTVERALRLWANDDPTAFREWGRNAAAEMFPRVSNPALEVLVGLSAGYDMGLDREILTDKEKKLSPGQQYDNRTPKSVVALSQAVGMSPKMNKFIIDKVAPGYSEGFFMLEDWVRRAASKDGTTERSAMKPEDYPVIGRFISRPGEGKQGRSVSLFYDRLDKSDRVYNDLRSRIEKESGRSVEMDNLTGNQRAIFGRLMQEMEPEDRQLYAQRKTLNKVSDRMGDIRKQIMAVESNTDMTPEKKRTELERLNRLMTATAQNAVKTFGIK